MQLEKLKKIGSGSLSDVYLIDNNKVLLVGKREDCFFNYQSLLTKSKLIDGKIKTIKYPKIFEVISPCDEFMFGAMVEEYVDGVELKNCISDLTEENKIQIGKQLALFLNELHCLDIEGNKQVEIEINTKKFEKSVSLLGDYLSKEKLKDLDIVKQKYISLMQDKDFCLTHGDLNAGNILILNKGELAGIIDFGNMEYYIPEVEFAHIYFFDKTIYNSMVKNYLNKIDKNDVVLIELVMNIRHFKNILNFEEKRKNCLNNIISLLEEYKKL